MGLYYKHKQLMEANERVRDEVEGFTQHANRGLMDRYNRN